MELRLIAEAVAAGRVQKLPPRFAFASGQVDTTARNVADGKVTVLAVYRSRIATALAMYYNGSNLDDLKPYGVTSYTHLYTLMRTYGLNSRWHFRKHKSVRERVLAKIGEIR